MKKIILLGCLLAPTLAFAGGASLYVCGGRAVSNSVSDTKSNAWCVAQETPTSFGTWDFGYLNEGHQLGDKRDGIYALPKFAYQLTKNVETSVAIGPYFTATTITEPDGVHYQDKYRWAALGFAKVKYSMNDSWSMFGEWGHVMYRRDNKDADLFLFGLMKKFN
jgi:hypothetical protein